MIILIQKSHNTVVFYKYWNNTIFLPQTRDELFRWDDADFFLLCSNAVEEICQAGKQALFASWLYFVGQHFFSERPTEIQSLQYWVTVTCVAKLQRKNKNSEVKRVINETLDKSWLFSHKDSMAKVPRISVTFQEVNINYNPSPAWACGYKTCLSGKWYVFRWARWTLMVTHLVRTLICI